MISREDAFLILAEAITDEIVVTGVGSQTSWWQRVKPRPRNLYLRGPMGLAPSVGLGVALAHPDRKVVVLEGDGGLLMGLTSLVAIAQQQPPNLRLICMDNGVYESGGQGQTVNTGRTDFIQVVRGLGIDRASKVEACSAWQEALRDSLAAEYCSYLHVLIGLSREKDSPALFRPAEVKFQFQAALKTQAGEK